MSPTTFNEEAVKRRPGRPKGRRVTVAIQARISPRLAEALGRAIEESKRTRNQELVLALEHHLRTIGLWPPLPDA